MNYFRFDELATFKTILQVFEEEDLKANSFFHCIGALTTKTKKNVTDKMDIS